MDLWNSLKQGLSDTVEKGKSALGMQSSPLVSDSAATQAIGTVPTVPGQTMTGGRRYSKKGTRRGGRKHRKTRKH